jgi:hypothetical protein
LIDLAISVMGDEDRVRRRLEKLLHLEGALAGELGVRPSIHG